MEEISELLEHELSDAVEVKDTGSLKRFVRLLAENAVGTSRYEKDQQGMREDMRALITEIHHIAENTQTGFAEMNRRFDELIHHMDNRFEHTDKRFESLDRRFSMMFTFITIGFSAITAVIVLLKFIGVS